jgi:hypothetical protein
LGAAACNDSTSGGVPPTTGVLVRAEQLTNGRGCGTGPTNLFKYVVVVFGFSGQGEDPNLRTSYNVGQASNVYDCYVDGEFVNLPAINGSYQYRLEVYAYNQAAYNASAAAIGSLGTNVGIEVDGGRSGGYAATSPTWTTQCTVTQSSNVETLAVCDPLQAGLGGLGTAPDKTTITLDTAQQFRLPDGRIGVCLPSETPDGGPTDAGTPDADAADANDDADAGDAEISDAEAGADAGPDADADASQTDASTPLVAFSTVRVRPRIGGTITAAAVDVPCGKPYSTEVSAEPATYTVDVGLIDSTGTPIGQTACAVTTVTGKANAIACP